MSTFRCATKSLVVAALFALVLAVGCVQPPVPGHVIVTGDSITWQGAQYSNYRDATVYAYGGLRASHTAPYVRADVVTPGKSPEVLVMAFGHNYYDTVMSPADHAELTEHALLPDDSACVVLVLPAYSGPDPQRAMTIDRYRAWATGFRDLYPTATVLADWAATTAAHPEYLTDDWVHVTEAGGVAFAGLVNDAVDVCLAK